MQWLDDEFAANGGRIDALFSEVGTYPALRRSYRKWLTELLDSSPQTADRLVLEVISNAALPAHSRDDTLVATLLSKDADTFLSRNSTELLRDHRALLWQTIHLLRVEHPPGGRPSKNTKQVVAALLKAVATGPPRTKLLFGARNYVVTSETFFNAVAILIRT
jgi:hypothetical protein